MKQDMDVIRTAVEWLGGGRPVALAMVVRTWGSAPRRAGSLLVATENARFEGSVSGGCVEAAVVDRAMELHGHSGADLLAFGVSNEEAWAVGLACGGEVEVHLVSIVPGSAEAQALAQVESASSGGRTPVLAFEVGGPGLRVTFPLEDDQDTSELAAAGRRGIAEDRAVRQDIDGVDRVLRPFNPPVRVILVGAVHVAQSLGPMVRLAGFECVIVDPRPAWLTEDRFPGLQRVAAWPADALADLRLDHRTAIVTLSHDPKLDDPALTAALATEAFYVGALGSRRTHAKRLARLQAADVQGLERIRAPVGLDLGAREPAEIAVSVLAEVLSILRLGPAAPDS